MNVNETYSLLREKMKTLLEEQKASQVKVKAYVSMLERYIKECKVLSPYHQLANATTLCKICDNGDYSRFINILYDNDILCHLSGDIDMDMPVLCENPLYPKKSRTKRK